MPKKAAPAPAPTPITGFRAGGASRRTRDAVCDWYELPEGELPLRVTLKRLNFEEIDALPPTSASFHEVWQAIHPYVLGWNVIGEDKATGELVPVPPPAEAGPDAFKVIDPEYTYWLVMQLRFGQTNPGVFEKKSPASAATPEPNDGKTSG